MFFRNFQFSLWSWDLRNNVIRIINCWSRIVYWLKYAFDYAGTLCPRCIFYLVFLNIFVFSLLCPNNFTVPKNKIQKVCLRWIRRFDLFWKFSANIFSFNIYNILNILTQIMWNFFFFLNQQIETFLNFFIQELIRIKFEKGVWVSFFCKFFNLFDIWEGIFLIHCIIVFNFTFHVYNVFLNPQGSVTAGITQLTSASKNLIPYLNIIKQNRSNSNHDHDAFTAPQFDKKKREKKVFFIPREKE